MTKDHSTMPENSQPFANVTRIEVIDGIGRSYASFNADNVIVILQDDGRTLKVIHDGDTSHGVRTDHRQALAEQLDALTDRRTL